MEEVFKQLEAGLRRRYYGWQGGKQFDGTGKRLLRMVNEFCWTSQKIEKELGKYFESAKYPDTYDETLIAGPISVWTLCPHHLMPCNFQVYLGYVPDEQVLGLSKFSRVAEVLARRPVIQEMYSRELADVLESKLKPKGVGVYVIGKHGCMTARGVRQLAGVSTSVLRGVIRDRPEIRAEFYNAVGRRNGS